MIWKRIESTKKPYHHQMTIKHLIMRLQLTKESVKIWKNVLDLFLLKQDETKKNQWKNIFEALSLHLLGVTMLLSSS